MGIFDKLKDAGKGALKEALKAGGVKLTYNGQPLYPQEQVQEEPQEELPTMPTVEYKVVTDFELYELSANEWGISKFIGFEEENIEIPAEIDGKKIVAIGDEVFATLKDIKNVKLAEGIRSIGAKAFFECGIQTILLPDTLQEVGECAFKDSDLLLISFPDNVTEIGKECFRNCYSLKRVKLPKNMDILRAELLHGCKALCELVFPDSPRIIEEKAVAATGLQLKEIPASITVLKDSALAYSFGKREKVEEIVLPPHLQLLGEGALSSISARKIVIPSSVKEISSEVFEFADNLEEIFIEDGCQATIAEGAFINCSNLKMLTIPKSVTQIGALFVKDGTINMIEEVKDEYGRQCYDEMTGEKILKHHSLAVKKNEIPAELTIYCEAGSAAMDFARENNIPYAKATY